MIIHPTGIGAESFSAAGWHFGVTDEAVHLGLGFGVLGSVFWVLCSGFWVLGSGFCVLGSVFWVLRFGFWVGARPDDTGRMGMRVVGCIIWILINISV